MEIREEVGMAQVAEELAPVELGQGLEEGAREENSTRRRSMSRA